MNEVAKAENNDIIIADKNKGLGVFSNSESFSLALRMADSLAKSTIVPKTYQNNPSNCMIAIEMASRINTSPMMVMQNLYIVNGSPAWSSQWIIAMINNSKRYKTELKFDLQYDNNGQLYSCQAWAEDYSGNKVVGPTITMKMAQDEGWIGKSGSKWRTMPEVMIRYRAASFFGRLNCPDMIMGIYSQEEVIDGFGDPIEGQEVVNTVVEPEEEKEATQEERQQLLDKITTFTTDRKNCNTIAKKVLSEVGVVSFYHMTVGQLNKALEIVPEIAEEFLAEQEGVEEK